MKKRFYTIYIPILLLFCALSIRSQSFAQAGSNDPSFNSGDLGFGLGDGTNNNVFGLAIQPDGKILIGGAFGTYNTIGRNRVARVNSDGSIDASFTPGTGASNTVNTVALQADGKILIGGLFTTYNGTARNRIARLNTDGTLDLSFNPGAGTDNTVSAIAIQPDGKILIGGNFTSYNGTAINRIARLNSDGTLDASFVVGAGADNNVTEILLQPDGKIIIGGTFLNYSGTAKNRITRLNTDGSIDAGFTIGTGFNNAVSALAIQTDGKIIVGGGFTSYNGTARNRIIRLNTNGTLDASFTIGTGSNGAINTIVVQPDGKFTFGGTFTTYNGTGRTRVARINADGTLDASFNPGTGANSTVDAMAIQADGKLLTAGVLTVYNSAVVNYLTRLNTNGTKDVVFNPGNSANNVITDIGIQSNGKILIAGTFTSYNGAAVTRLARLNVDGSLDVSFNPGTGANSTINAIAIQSDGKIIIAGAFTNYGGTARNYIARVNSNGTIDASFNPGTGASAAINKVVIQADGKIVIAGTFLTYNGTTVNRVARLNTNGSLDASFTMGTGFNNTVSSLLLQNDGKIILGGVFTTYNGITNNRIIRLNADGTADAGFTIGTGANNSVNAIELQADSKILIGGAFTNYNGTGRNRIARLNTDGTLDVSFTPGTGANNTVTYIALMSDNKIAIAGSFTTYSGTARARIALLNPTGVLDAGFNPGAGAANTINSVKIQSDGKILVAGSMTSYDNIGRNRIARIIDCSTKSMAMSNQSQSKTVAGTTVFSFGCSDLVATLNPNGISPVSGNTSAKLWIEPTQHPEYVKRHYEINPTNNPGLATARITLYFTQAEFNDFNLVSSIKLPANPTDIVGISNLLIEKRGGVSSDGSGLPLTYPGAPGTIDPLDSDIIWNSTLNRWEVSFDVTGFSGFFVKTVFYTLPTTLVSFNAKKLSDEQILLQWKTTNEQALKQYEVERSTNGRDYSKVGTSVIARNSTQSNEYQLIDYSKWNETTRYYRLKMIDNDYQYRYSSVIVINNNKKSTISFYPNPTKDQLFIDIAGSNLINSRVSITDQNGRMVKSVMLSGSVNAVNISDLSPGVYVVRLADGSNYKVIKQ
jgi:uncharacterized delta-60 repeat protein